MNVLAASDWISVSGVTYKSGVISASATAINYVVVTSPQSKTATIKSSSSDYNVKVSGTLYVTVTEAAGKVEVNGNATAVAVGESEIPIDACVTSSGGLTIKITSGDVKNAKITMTFTPNLEQTQRYAVTFLPDDNGKAYSVGGTSITAKTTINVDNGLGAAIVAAPSGGQSCIGLIDVDTNKLVCGIDSTGNATMIPTKACTVKPYYVTTPSATPFKVNGKLYYSWESAFLAGGLKYPVILNANYTLPTTYAANCMPAAGNYVSGSDNNLVYTVPKGSLLLIPYNDQNTVCEVIPSRTDDSYTAPSIYRTLTVNGNTGIVVDGAISIAGTQSSKFGYNGLTSGPVGALVMSSNNNSITVNKGGRLYAWGYVAGSGMVTVKSGGAVYEDFQVRDYRGGDATSDIVNKFTGKHMFTMSQYYIQNVQVPMKLEAGAIEKGHMSVSVSLAGTQSGEVPFVGDTGSMFKINSGYIIKDYDEKTDRQIYDIHGNVELNQYTINIKVVILGKISINSGDFHLPITNNMTINVHDGYTVDLKQHLLLTPGSVFNIEEGATVNVKNNQSLIVYDLEQWNDAYCSTSKKLIIPLGYVHTGKGIGAPTVTRKEADLVDAKLEVNGTLDASAGYLYTTADGGDICSSGTGKVIVRTTPESLTHQAVQTEGGMPESEFVAHTLYPAWLHNEGGDYVDTAKEVGTYTYYEITGRWDRPSHFYESEVTEPTCEDKGYTTHTCAVCGNSYQDTEVPAKGHTFGTEVAAQGATCAAAGNAAYKQCTACNLYFAANAAANATDGKSDTSSFVIAQKDHSYTGAIQSDGNGKDATHSFQCVNGCGYYGGAVKHTWDAGVVTTNPDCESEGVKTFTCTAENCGATYTATVDALGHTKGDDAKTIAATCTEKGSVSYTCTICQTPTVEELDALGGPHDWEGGECSKCTAQFLFKQVNMAVNEGLDLYFYIKKSDVQGLDGQLVCKFTKQYADDRGDKVVEVTDFEEKGDYFRVCFSNIAAKEMKDSITGQILFKDSTKAASYDYSETVFDHIHDLYEQDKKNTAMATVLADLLNYGAACQTLFNYGTENLATKDADTTLMSYATAATEENPPAYSSECYKRGTHLYGTAFSAVNKLMFTFYYDFEQEAVEGSKPTIDPSQFSARVTYTGDDGKTVIREYDTINWFQMRQGDTVVYGLDVDGITLTGGRTTITCELINKDTKVVVSTSVDSIPSYTARAIEAGRDDLGQTMLMLLRAVDSAVAYFN